MTLIFSSLGKLGCRWWKKGMKLTNNEVNEEFRFCLLENWVGGFFVLRVV